MTLRIAAITLVLTVGAAGAAQAQSTPQPFRFGTTLSGFAGAAADTMDVHPAAGLALGWEMTRRLTIEGTTLWTMPGDRQTEFGVLIGPRVNVTASRRLVPFVSGGVGMYRASFSNRSRRIPAFYERRMRGMPPVGSRDVFQDFAVAMGGGAEFFMGNHWSVRPDVRVLLVTGDSNHRWITAAGGHLAYHFEPHRITQ